MRLRKTCARQRIGKPWTISSRTKTRAANVSDPLKLLALDSDDLAVISAHLQHGQLRVSDLAYLPGERRFALCLGRYEWGACPGKRRAAAGLTGLHFERVLAAQMRNL